jgi:hypothetical protein
MIQHITLTLHFSSFLITLTVSEQPLHSTVGKILLPPSPGPHFNPLAIPPFKNTMDPVKVVPSRSDHHQSQPIFKSLPHLLYFLSPASAPTSSRRQYHSHRRARLSTRRRSCTRSAHLPVNGYPSPISRRPDLPLPG